MDLDNLEQEIRQYASKKEVSIIEATALDEEKVIDFIVNDYPEIIDLASQLDKKIIIISVAKFDEENLEIKEKEIGDRNKAEEFKREFKKYLGKNLYIGLYCINEGIVFNFHVRAEWHLEFVMKKGEVLKSEELDETSCKECGTEIFVFEEYCSECLKKKRKAGEEKTKEVAKELANNNEFSGLKNDAERKLFIEEKYPDLKDNEYVRIGQITPLAKAFLNSQKRKN